MKQKTMQELNERYKDCPSVRMNILSADRR